MPTTKNQMIANAIGTGTAVQLELLLATYPGNLQQVANAMGVCLTFLNYLLALPAGSFPDPVVTFTDSPPGPPVPTSLSGRSS